MGKVAEASGIGQRAGQVECRLLSPSHNMHTISFARPPAQACFALLCVWNHEAIVVVVAMLCNPTVGVYLGGAS